MAEDGSGFQAFVGGFSLAKPSLGPQRSVSITTATTKRRKIELAPAATVPLASIKPPKRAKSPAKKPQTITDRATKAFQAPPAVDESVSRFFTPDPTTTAARPDQQKPKRKRAKKATSAKPPPPILYPPEKALLQAESQQFLFATSSQLAVEDSPKLIKETVVAVEASEVPLSARLATNLSLRPAEKQHWGSSRRDFKGGMLRDTSGLLRKAPAPKSPVKSSRKDESWTVLTSSSPPAVLPRPLAPDELPLQQKDTNIRLPVPTSPEKPVRKRGRPPKKKQHSPAETSFANIDEISDPESPATPSPPRRRASASPRPLHALHLSPSRSFHATVDIDALTATAQLKAHDGQWPSVSKRLFPLITRTLKAMPRSTNPERPSWYQKILLYDPIVLEDITAALNEQGLRISIRRKKTKTAAKRGKKAAKEGPDGEAAAAARESGMEIESVDELLQPWMVQKWCEEHSVCCLWREGLRGGVRTRY